GNVAAEGLGLDSGVAARQLLGPRVERDRAVEAAVDGLYLLRLVDRADLRDVGRERVAVRVRLGDGGRRRATRLGNERLAEVTRLSDRGHALRRRRSAEAQHADQEKQKSHGVKSRHAVVL